jgi:hypothetical protein
MTNHPPVQLTDAQRKKLMLVFLDTSSFDQRQLVHFLLLSADGHSPAKIAEVTNSEVAEVEACLQRYDELGLSTLLKNMPRP